MSKRRNLLFAVLATLFCTIFAFACAPKKAPKPDDPPPGPGTVTPEVTYTVTFDANGGAFADGSEQQKVTGVKEGATVTAPEVSREDYDFTGWHTDSEATTKVDLSVYAVKADVTLYAGWEEEGGTPTPPPAQATLDSISVTPPTKTSYIQGQSIDLTGFKVTAKYSDNSEKQVAASDCTFSPELDAVTATPGNDKVITVTYEGKTDTFKINVAAKVVTELKIEGSLNKFNYNIGEQFNPEGLVFKATYNDDTTQTIPAAQITFTSENPAFSANKTFTLAGSVEITASYGGVSATDKISVTVVERFTVTFSSNVMELGLSSTLVENMPNAIPDVEKNSKINAPSAQPTLKAYTFGGWYKETACINEWNFATDVVDGAVTTLYAKWTAVGAFNITYHNIDGATNPNPATYTPTSNKYATLTLQNAQKEHYNFDGWYTAATGGVKKTSLTYTDLPTNQATAINLYARFTPKTYSITFDLVNTGHSITITPNSSPKWNTTYTYGTSVALPTADDMTITKNAGDTTNYSFAGWKIRAQGGTLTDINGEYLTKDNGGTGDVTLVPDISTVALVPFTYDFNYDVTPRTETVNIREGQPASTSKIADPTRLGYTFDGWYDNAQGTGSKYDFARTTIASGNTYIVYAKWTENSYIISYNLSELSGAHTTNTTSYKITDREVTLSDPTNLTTGYYFLGWFTEAGGSGDRVTALNPTLIEGKANGGTVTLYAHFDNKYTVTFDTQGGSPTPSQKTLAYGSTVADVADPTRANYTFDGWYTGATDGVKWVFGVGGSTVPAQNITLYARWIENADDGWYIVPVGTKLTKANAADYVMTNSARSSVSLGLNSEFEVFSYTKSNGSKQYRAVTPTVKPAAAMTVTLTGNVYKATVYNAGNSATWDVKVTTGLEITMHGYFDTRKPNGEKKSLTPANAVNGTAYVAGNFTGASSAITSEWANATAIGGKFYWQNVSLVQFDRLHVRYNGNDATDIDVTNTGNYNIVFDPTQNTVTLYAVSEQTLTVSVDGSKIFVGDTAAVIREKRISAITVKLGDSPLLSEDYELVLFDAVAGANASKVIAIYQGTVVEKTYTATAVAESGVAIEFESDAKSYYWGDTPQAGDYTVTVLYNNGSSQEIKTGFTLTLSGAGSTSNLFASAKGSVGVSYKTFNASIEVDVFNKVTSVAVAVKDGGLSFVEGTEFKLASGDITVTVTFNDDSQKRTTIGSDKYTLNPAVDTTLALGTSSVTLTYNGYGNAHTTFPITVTEKQVTSISVNATAANVKKDYTYGEALVKTGLVVTATYNNNTTRPLGEGEYTLELIVDTAGGATNPFAPITGSIKVKYSDTITDEYQITYHNKVTSLQINKKQGVAFEYIEGTSFTLNDGDITVTAYFNNTTSLNATLTSEQYTLSPAVGDKLDTVGTQTITVTCNNTTVTATFDVTVKAKSVTSLTIEGAPTTTSYKVGGSFNTAGLTITANYDNGTSDEVTSLATFKHTVYDTELNKFIASGVNVQLVACFGGQEKKIETNLTVTDVLSGIKVTTQPAKPHGEVGYVENDVFSYAYMVVTATYNRDIAGVEPHTRPVSGYTVKVDDSDNLTLTVGTHTIKVEYGGFSDTFTIDVVALEIVRLEVVGSPVDQYDGDLFNPEGLTFTVTYNNETSRNLTNDEIAQITYTGDIYDSRLGGFYETSNSTSITATYSGVSFEIKNVKVISATFVTIVYNYRNGDYDVNGPSNGRARYNYAIGQEPTTPTSKGFTFDGWYKDEACTEKWDFATAINYDNIDIARANNNLTAQLYGKWASITYTLTLTDLDGKTVEFTPSTTDRDYSVSLDDVTAASGYRFKGWTFVGNDGNPVKTFTYALLLKATVGENNTITLTAVFEQIQYVKVTFDINYGDTPAKKEFNVEVGSALSDEQKAELEAFANREGWTFDGWFEVDGQTKWLESDTFDTDKTFYAKWTEIKYTVSFDVDGGDKDATAHADQKVAKNGKVTEPTVEPTKEGYKFDGWVTTKGGTTKWNFAEDKVTKDTTIYAKWTANDGIWLLNTTNNKYEWHNGFVKSDDNPDTEVAAKGVVLNGGAKFKMYRNGTADTTKVKSSTTNTYLKHFTLSGTIYTVASAGAGVYNLYNAYAGGDVGLWVEYICPVDIYEEPDIRDGDGIYVGNDKVADWVVNSNSFNQIMAKDVTLGDDKNPQTVTVTLKYKGQTAGLDYVHCDDGLDAKKGTAAGTFTVTAGKYTFYYNYAKRVAEPEKDTTDKDHNNYANRLWVSGTKFVVVKELTKDYYYVGTLNGWATNNASYKFDKTSASITLDLPQNTTFKIVTGSTWLGYTNVSIAIGGEYVSDAGGNDHNIKVTKSGKYKLVFAEEGNTLSITRIGDYAGSGPEVEIASDSVQLVFNDVTVILTFPLPSWDGVSGNASIHVFKGNTGLTGSWPGTAIKGNTITLSSYNVTEIGIVISFVQSGVTKQTQDISGSSFATGGTFEIGIGSSWDGNKFTPTITKK